MPPSNLYLSRQPKSELRLKPHLNVVATNASFQSLSLSLLAWPKSELCSKPHRPSVAADASF